MFQVLVTMVVGYALLALFVMVRQRRFLYLPTRMQESVATTVAAQNGFEPWRDTNGALIGWRRPATAPSTSAVLILHGNAGFAGNRSYLALPIHQAAALDVYVLEYPGYGARPGSPTKATILRAADEAFAQLRRYRSVYLVSESLGAGAAAHLAARNAERVAGLALFAPYDRLSSVAQYQMPFLPAAWMLWDRFAPIESLAHYSGPVVFVVAGADAVIPAKFGQRLHDQYGGPKKFQLAANAGHNDVAEQPIEWWKETIAFWQKHAVGDSTRQGDVAGNPLQTH